MNGIRIEFRRLRRLKASIAFLQAIFNKLIDLLPSSVFPADSFLIKKSIIGLTGLIGSPCHGVAEAKNINEEGQ
jgi:hypothetical protein